MLILIQPYDFRLVRRYKLRFRKNVAAAMGRNLSWNVDVFKIDTDAITCKIFRSRLAERNFSKLTFVCSHDDVTINGMKVAILEVNDQTLIILIRKVKPS